MPAFPFCARPYRPIDCGLPCRTAQQSAGGLVRSMIATLSKMVQFDAGRLRAINGQHAGADKRLAGAVRALQGVGKGI